MPFPTTLTSRFLVYTNASAESEPTVAAGRDGRFSIEWSAVFAAQNDVYSDIYQGRTIGTDGLGALAERGATSGNIETNPDTAFLNNGAHVLTYEQVVGGNRDIYVRIHTKDTNGSYTYGTSVLVNTGATTGSQFRPEIAALTGGGFVVAWEDNNDTTIKLQRYDAAGIAQGAVLPVTSMGPQVGGSFSFDLAALSNGGFAISYQNTGGLTVAKLSAWDASGTALVTNLDASAQVAGAAHGAVSLTQLPNGNIGAFWRDADGGGVGYRIFNSSFVPQTGDLLIPVVGVLTGANGEIPRVAATLDNRFMVVFGGGLGALGGVYGQMVTSSGALDGVATLISGTTNTSGEPEIECTADGRMLVTWQEAGDIYAAIYETRTAGLSLTGTTGNDNYVGTNSFSDTINGGDGDDTLSGLAFSDLLLGGDGNDLLEGGFDSDTLYGGNGDDRLFSNDAANPNGSGYPDVMLGEAGNDTLTGSTGDDNLSGGADNDSLIGSLGNDVLFGDAGNDTLDGGAGTNYLYGGSGSNSMTGGSGLDIFVAEGSIDLMTGGDGTNYYYRGAAGFAAMTGGTGQDIYIGGAFASNDTFQGFGGDDYAQGGDGDDLLEGGANNDILLGGNGNDILDGGSGSNYLYMDGGNDQARVVASGGVQLLVGFDAGGVNDSVRLLSSTLTSFANFQALVTNLGTVVGGNLLQNTGVGAILTLNLGTGSQTDIWFLGTLAGGITAADITFV
jgi:Ca2+-binding RTX toxin-like protein